MNPQDHSPVLMQPEDAGAVVYSTRSVPGPRAVLLVAVLVVAVWTVLLFVPESGPMQATVATSFLLVFLLLLFGAGMLDHHRVCENALVLGLAPWPGGQAYVIPWSTVSPDSLTLHKPLNRPGRPAAETGSRGARTAVYSTRGVSLAGLHADLAHPRRRVRSATARELLRMTTPEQLEQNPPRIRWVMGARDPERLLRAIESAMVRHRPEAEGSAERAIAHPVSGGHSPGSAR